MASSTNLADVPYFFKGTYDNLVLATSPGGLFGNLKKVGIAYVTDRKCLAYVQTNGTITLVGDTTQTVQPEEGTVAQPVVLDELPAGVYSIKGTYQTTATEAPISTSATQLFVVGENGTISKMDGDAMTKQVVTSSGAVVEETYVTDADVIRSMATKQDITDLFT